MSKDKKWLSPYWRVEEALEEALSWLEEKDNLSLRKVGQGRRTEMYSLKSHKYPFPLAIKIPTYGEEIKMEEAKRKLIRDGWEMGYGMGVLPQYFPKVCMYEEGGRFLIREYFDGEPLMEYLKTQTISTRQMFFYKITRMTAKVMELYYNFTQGAKIFGDFRPENIIVDPVSQEFRLIDCGSVLEEKLQARKQEKRNSVHLGEGNTHIPPEVLLDMSELCDRRIDFFGYGVMAYELLFLAPPYSNGIKEEKGAWKKYHEEYAEAVKRVQTGEETQGIPHDLLMQCIGSMHPDAHKRFCGQLITE